LRWARHFWSPCSPGAPRRPRAARSPNRAWIRLGAIRPDHDHHPAGTGEHHAEEPALLVINLTGNGTLSTLTYIVAGKSTTETGVAVPWRKSLELPAGAGTQEWSLHGELGTAACSPSHVGRQVVTQGSISVR